MLELEVLAWNSTMYMKLYIINCLSLYIGMTVCNDKPLCMLMTSGLIWMAAPKLMILREL